MTLIKKLYTRYIKPVLEWLADKAEQLLDNADHALTAVLDWHRAQLRTNPHYKPALLVLAIAVLQTLAADSVAGAIATQLILFLRTMDSGGREWSHGWRPDQWDDGGDYPY